MSGAAGSRPPQGVVIRHIITGNPRRDFLEMGPNRQLPRVDPACFGEAVFLALPVEGAPGRVKIRKFNPETAAELFTLEPVKQRGIRLATDEEVEAYLAAEKARTAALLEDRAARARALEERNAADRAKTETTRQAIRELYANGKA